MRENSLTPIQTEYNGYLFRSRLEARWAVFFDTLNVDYEYEPEGYLLSNGKCYLPDFKIKCYGTRGSHGSKYFNLYIEVKGEMTKEDAEKINLFAGNINDPCSVENPVLVVGNIPKNYDDFYVDCNRDDGAGCYFYNYYTIDGDFFGAFPAATADGRFYLFGDDCNYINGEDVPRINRALRNARQARFEHGQKGVLQKATNDWLQGFRQK